MNESEFTTSRSFRAAQLKRKLASSTPSPQQDESSQTTATTASATISTTQSFSESTIGHRRRIVDTAAATKIRKPSSDTKLINLQRKWNTLSPKRLFQAGSDDDASDAAILSNDSEESALPGLPQEQLNALEMTESTSSDLSSEHQHLRLLRERVELQVQSMSQYLLESPVANNQRRKSRKSTELAIQHFQAVSSQVVTDFLEDSPHKTPRAGVADSSSQAKAGEVPRHGNAEAEPERRPQAEQFFQEEDPKVSLLQQQRSKLQQRIRELLHDTGQLRQERNVFRNQNMEQSRQIQALHESLTGIQEEKTKSETMLQQHIVMLQSKSTQLLEELQQSRRAQQHEALLRIQLRNEVMQRMATLELEKKRLQRAHHRQQQTPNRENVASTASTPIQTQRSDEETVSSAATSSSLPLPGGSVTEQSPANHRLQQMKSEVKSRRARIEAIRRKRSDEEEKPPSPSSSHDPVMKSRSPEVMTSSSPQAPAIQEPPQLRKLHVNSSMDRTASTDVDDDPMGITSFLDRIDSVMEASASEFANKAVVVELKQDIVNLQQRNLHLEMSVQEAEDHASLLETSSKETALKLQEATDRETALAKELEERTREGSLTQSSLQDLQQMFTAKDDDLRDQWKRAAGLENQLSERHAECGKLKEQTKRIPKLEQKHSELLESAKTYKAQNRSLSSQIDELEIAVVEMEMANGALEDQVRGAEGDLRRQQELISKLSTELRSTSAREVAARKEHESTLSKRATLDKAEQQRLQERVNLLQSNLEEVLTELEDSQTHKESLKAELQGKQKEQERANLLQSSFEEVKKQLEESRMHGESLKLELQGKQEEHEISIADSGKRQAYLNRKVQDLEQELNKVKEQCEAMTSKNKNLREELKSQAMTLVHAEDVQKELATKLVMSEFEVERQLECSTMQEEELSRLTALTLGLSRSAEPSASKEGSPSKSPASSQRRALEAKLASVSNELTATSELRLTLEKQLQDLHSSFKAYPFSGDSEVKDIGELVMNRQIKDLERAISKLKLDCDQMTSKNTRTQDQNDALKQLLAISEQQRRDLEETVSEYESELDRLREDAVVLEARDIALQNDRMKLASENEIYASIETELESRLADASKLIDTSVPRMKELEREIVALEKDVEDRDTVLEALRCENIGLVERVKGLETEKETAGHERSELLSKLQEQAKKRQELESSLQRNKEELASLQSKAMTLEVQMLNQDASKGHVGIIKAQILQLAELKNELLHQIRQGSAQGNLRQAMGSGSYDVVVELQGLRIVLEAARDHINASRDDCLQLERKIDSLNDENTYLTIRNTSLEKEVEEVRLGKEDMEKLLAVSLEEMGGLRSVDFEEASPNLCLQMQITTPVHEDAKPVAAPDVAKELAPTFEDTGEERFQVNYVDNKSAWLEFKSSPPRAAKVSEVQEAGSDALDTHDQESQMRQDAPGKDKYFINKTREDAPTKRDRYFITKTDSETTTGDSFSPISEIDSEEDLTHQSIWGSLSEIDSEDGGSKNFPPSEDVSDLSHGSTLEPYSPYHVPMPPPEQVSRIQEPTASSQLETLTTTQTFHNLVTPRVTNTAHPENISRHPPEYSITLGALTPNPQVRSSTTDHPIGEDSPLAKKTLKF